MTNGTCNALTGCAVSLGGSEVKWFTLPCAQEFAGFFMILVYAYERRVASSLLCKGLEHLDNTMSAYSKRYPKNGCAKNFKQIIGGALTHIGGVSGCHYDFGHGSLKRRWLLV